MKCEVCNFLETRVIDSRWIPPNKVKRRRECPNCLKRFTTYEQTAYLSYPTVTKRDNTVVPFNEQKIRNGILRALEKRPMAHEFCEQLMQKIVTELLQTSVKNLNTSQIGDCVMKYLLEIDHVAYVRFASVYKHFENIEAFHIFLAELSNKMDNKSE